MTDEVVETKVDFSKVRKNSRDYKAMTDEQRAAWNEYQKEKQREYRRRRKAEKEALEETLAETVNAAPKQVDEVVGVVDEEHQLYICSDCGQPLKGIEDTCPKCGVLCDWRGTDIVNSEDYIVCDLCGFVEPLKEFNGKCKRCNWGGE